MDIKRLKFNVSLLGESMVGKTCMVSNLKGFEFDSNKISTIGVDDIIDEYTIDNKLFKFKIFDTAGQERYRSISTKTIQLADGFFIVFSFDLRESFERLNFWIDSIDENVDINKKSLILIGNKIDIPEEEKKIKHEEAVEFANKHNMKYYETSAKTGFNIKESFHQLYEDIYNLNKKKDEKPANMELKKEEHDKKKQKNKKC